MTIFLHTGSPKAGSTTIQAFLKKNERALAEHGYFLPKFLGSLTHTKLAVYGRNNGNLPSRLDARLPGSDEEYQLFRSTLEQEFTETIDQDKNYIISTESLGLLLQVPAAKRTVAFLTSTGKDIKVIQYFRDPSEYLASVYSNSLRRGATDSDMRPQKENVSKRYNYLAICNQWASCIGDENVLARPLVRDRLVNGDLIDDFLTCLGLKSETFAGFKRIDTQLNKSLDYLVAGFLLEINRSGSDQNKEKVRKALNQLSSVISKREGILVPKETRDWLRDQVADDLALFNERFFGGKREWPFPPYREDNKRPITTPSKDEMLEIFCDILEKTNYKETDKKAVARKAAKIAAKNAAKAPPNGAVEAAPIEQVQKRRTLGRVIRKRLKRAYRRVVGTNANNPGAAGRTAK